MSQQEKVQELITEHLRRLHQLKKQKAKLGIDTPPERLTEIEDIEEEIEQLQSSLKTNNVTDPPETKKMPVSQSPQPPLFLNQFDKLLTRLNRLTDVEFRNMIRTLLTVEEQNSLSNPINRITRGDFLGDIQAHGLDKVENYLCHKYPNRFLCEGD